jgi:hypothetical protein
MRCITYIQILGYVSGGGSNYVATKRSRRPPSAQSFPIEDKKQDKLKTTKSKNMAIEINYNSITRFAS